MNRYQEALEEAKLEYAITTDEGAKAKQKAFATLQDLVDRAIPRNVLTVRMERLHGLNDRPWETVGFCPHCHEVVYKKSNQFFCPHKDCGQALEWEEGEKK